MSATEDVRNVLQDHLAPELGEISARLDALEKKVDATEKRAETNHSEVNAGLRQLTPFTAMLDRLFSSMKHDPCLHDLKPSQLRVGIDDGFGHLTNIFPTSGWEMNFEEDDHVLFSYFVTNSGPKPVRVAHCKPFTTGPWQIIDHFPPVANVANHLLRQDWRADNDSNYFFVEIETTGSIFSPMDGNPPQSTAKLNGQKTVVQMEWHHPQHVTVEVRARDTRP